MQPLFEKVTVSQGASWALLDRRLEEGIPFEWHYHPEFELTLTLNSRGQRYIGDSVAPYDDGDLVLLGPNLPHTWYSTSRHDPSQPHHAVVIWFTENWAATLVDTLPEMLPMRLLLAGAGRGFAFSSAGKAAVRPLIEAIPELAPAERLVRLMEVLVKLSADTDRTSIAAPGSDSLKTSSPDQLRIERVLDYIHAHYREPISVGTLAGVAALSSSGFLRLFRRHTKLTVGAYLAQLRIGQACAILVNTERPVAHVAEAVGYANLSNFNRRFRAAKGMTPREFRRSFVP